MEETGNASYKIKYDLEMPIKGEGVSDNRFL